MICGCSCFRPALITPGPTLCTLSAAARRKDGAPERLPHWDRRRFRCTSVRQLVGPPRCIRRRLAVYKSWRGVLAVCRHDAHLVARAAGTSPGRFQSAGLCTGIFVRFLTNVLNPRCALFLAFLPHSLRRMQAQNHSPFSFWAIFDFNGTIWNLLIAWSTARLSSKLALGALKQWFN